MKALEYNDTAVDCYEKGNFDKAIECWQKAIELEPDFAEAFFNMGMAYETKGNKSKAAECKKKAEELRASF
jgi:superkiller protein 3